MADKDKFEQKLTRMEEISKALSDPETGLQKAVDLYDLSEIRRRGGARRWECRFCR